jgi:hypothetical protein
LFLSPPYAFEPAGLFSAAHLALLLSTVGAVAVGLWLCRSMTEAGVRRIILVSSLLLWTLEILKIAFVLLRLESPTPNEYVPLYFCSIVLAAAPLSALGRGRLRLAGDAFLATAGLVGGAVFLLMPTTSLPRYPALHFISLHSFLLHGLMVFLGILLLLRGVYRVKLRDIGYPALLVSIFCGAAYLFNMLYDRLSSTAVANLMFLSKDFPGTPLSLLYHTLGRFYPLFMWLFQAFGPFLLVWLLQMMLHPKGRGGK